jgi:hypothetical protein
MIQDTMNRVSCVLCIPSPPRAGSSGPVLSGAARCIDVEESDQNVRGDGENDIQSSQSLEVVIGVALQPIHWYGDDAVDYEQRSDQEMFLSWFKSSATTEICLSVKTVLTPIVRVRREN